MKLVSIFRKMKSLSNTRCSIIPQNVFHTFELVKCSNRSTKVQLLKIESKILIAINRVFQILQIRKRRKNLKNTKSTQQTNITAYREERSITQRSLLFWAKFPRR